MESQKTNYGIVLSGGGARGLAHIGVLAALEHHGISPKFVSGNSMGAVIGAFYAAGIHPDKMLAIAKQKKLYKLFKWSLPKGGMLHLDLLLEMLETNIPQDSFEALPKKLFIAVSNISEGEGEIISSGPLFRAVLASASIPIVFQPQVIDGHTYVDGGLFNDLPVDPLVGICDCIIASHVNYNGPEPELKSIKAIAERVYRMAIYQHVRKNMQKCDYVIDPPELREHGIFDFKHIDKLYEIGYNAAEKVILSMVDQLNIDHIIEKKK